MTNSLYDLLEVNQSASPEAISAAYHRLHAKFSAHAGNEDATNQLIALREAYNILSSAEKRLRYDQRLEARASDNAASGGGSSFVKLLLLASLVGVFGIGYAKYQSEQEKARLERERITAEAKLAEVAAQKEHDEKLAAEKAEIQRRRDEALERYNRERDIAYGNQVSRDLQRNADQARREREREEQQRANSERQQKYEAERELAKEKAYLRQLEAENARHRRY